MNKTFHDRLILLDDQETYLLSSWLCDDGIALCVTGPHVILMHEHKVTELNGSPLRLSSPDSRTPSPNP